MISRFVKSDFLKNVAVLMSGTMIAQVLSYFFIPIISRVYTPDERAEMDLFVYLVAFGVAIATARYELAIPIVKSRIYAFRLFKFSIRIATISCLAFLLLSIIPIAIENFRFDRIIYFILVPVAIFSLAFFNLGNNWSLREKMFKRMSYARMTNSLTGNISKVLLGIFGIGYLGLVLGTVLGYLSGGTWFFKDFKKSNQKLKVKPTDKPTWVLAKQQRDFPRVNLPHVLMETGRDICNAVIVLEMFGKTDLGLYGQSYQMLRLPLAFVGVALGQVFFQRCAELVNQGKPIYSMLLKSIRTLFLLSIIPFGVVILFGEDLFEFVLGEQWRMSGRYSSIIAPWLGLNFIMSPLSFISLIMRRQKEFFILSVFATIALIGSFYIPHIFFGQNFEQTLYFVCLGQSIYLIVAIFITLYYAKKADAV